MSIDRITDQWRRGTIKLRHVDSTTGELKTFTGAVKREPFIHAVVFREGNKRAHILCDMEVVHSFEPFDKTDDESWDDARD